MKANWYQSLSPERRRAYSARVNARQKALHSTRLAAGLCVDCAAPAAQKWGRVLRRCADCLREVADVTRASRATAKEIT